MDIGLARERRCSRQWHTSYRAVLISPQVLRRRGLGQVDICFEGAGGVLVVLEVKGYGPLSWEQGRRLKKSCQWLGALLDRDVVFQVAHLKKEL